MFFRIRSVYDTSKEEGICIIFKIKDYITIRIELNLYCYESDNNKNQDNIFDSNDDVDSNSKSISKE